MGLILGLNCIIAKDVKIVLLRCQMCDMYRMSAGNTLVQNGHKSSPCTVRSLGLPGKGRAINRVVCKSLDLEHFVLLNGLVINRPLRYD